MEITKKPDSKNVKDRFLKALEKEPMTCTEISQVTKIAQKTLCFIKRRFEKANKVQAIKRVVCRVTGRRAYLIELL